MLHTLGIHNTGLVYALVVAVNLAANFTLFGALAGMLWSQKVNESGVSVKYTDFLKVGVIVTPITLAMSLLAISLL